MRIVYFLRLGLSGASYLHISVGQLCTEGEGKMLMYHGCVYTFTVLNTYIVCGYSHKLLTLYTVGGCFQL